MAQAAAHRVGIPQTRHACHGESGRVHGRGWALHREAWRGWQWATGKNRKKKWENLGNQATIAHVLTTVFLVSPLRRNELTNRIRGIRQDMRELEQQAWRIKQSISKSWIVVSRCLQHLSGSKKIGLFFKSQANWSIDTGTCESVCSNQAHLGKRSQTH